MKKLNKEKNNNKEKKISKNIRKVKNKIMKNEENERIGVKFEEKKDYRKLIIFSIIGIFIIIFSIIFSLLNMTNNKIYSNIKIEKIDVAKLTSDEANEIINKKYRENKINGIQLLHGDYNTTISYDQIDVDAKIDNAVQKAYLIGRKGNIITNNYSIFFTLFTKKDIKIDFEISENNIENIINDIESKLPDAKIESTYYIEGNKLIIRKGSTGSVIDEEKLKEEIINKIKNITDEERTIEIPVKTEEPQKIDIEKIANEIKKSPQNAYLSKDPLAVHADENGIDLAISIDEAKQILSEDKEEYEIPLNITEASIKVTDLGEDAFPNRLASYTTNYDASNVNRNNNLMLAATKLNGTIINPGEIFSYNKTIGQRTIDAGYKEAKAYAGGKIVLDVGGGICQLSSTLYNTVLLTNLEVTERHNHYFQTSYVAAGRDATVSWGSVDLKFKNNRKYPIKILAKAEDGVVKVDIYGIKEDDDYTVVIDSKVTSIIGAETKYQEDNSLQKDQEVISQNGEDGCTSETYKTLIKNGVILSKTLVSKDTYNPLTKIVKRNT